MVKQKTVHDGNKRKDASVTMHGQGQLAPNEQWEVNIEPTYQGNDELPSRSFLAMPGRLRAQPHKKVNECDH